MRVVIAQEGVEEIPGQVLEPGSVKWEEGRDYPIDWEANFAMGPMGIASDLQRDDNGYLTADIEISSKDALVLLADVGTTIWANELVEHKVDGVRHVDSCQIKTLYLTLGVPWRNLEIGADGNCPTPGCPGDIRYAPPGRGHLVSCKYLISDD